MKNLARVLSLVLVLTMMVSSVAFAGTFTDIAEGSAYADATTILSGLGIINGYEDGSFGPDKVITRAEVTAIVNRLQGLSDAAKAAGGTTAYTDVAADAWYAGDVNLATQMGIIEGDGNGLFRPEDPVKYEEAVKMMVAACGYNKSYVLSRGGWPTGYLVIASESDITKGLAETAGAPAYRGIVAKLAYQALTAPMMVLDGYQTNGTSIYVPKEDKVLLEQKLGFIKLTGYVYGNSVSSLTTDSVTEEGVVNFMMTAKKIGTADNDYVLEADGTKKITNLLAGKSGVEATLGLDADIYVKENAEGKMEVVAYALQPAKSTVVAIENVEDIQPFGAGSKDSKWNDPYYLSVYDADEDAGETYTLDKDAVIILNGNNIGKVATAKDLYINTFAANVETTSSATALGYVFAPTNGTVELVDRGNDGAFDFINVTSYETTILDDAPYANNTMISTFAGTINLDFRNVKNADYTITLDGEAIEVADLKKDDVISVAKTDKNHWDIKVSRATVSGQIAEMDAVEGIYVIDGKEYVAANLYDATAANLGSVNAGDEGVFFLDAFGNIALFDATATATKDYGFIVAAGAYTSIGETEYEVRILDKTGATKTYVLAENVRYGVAGQAAVSTPATTVWNDIVGMRLYSAPSTTADSSAVWTFQKNGTYYDGGAAAVTNADLAANYAARIITFKANSEGKITAITTAVNDATDTKNFAFYGAANLKYNAKHSAFDTSVGVTEDTIVFNLPITATSTKDDFAVATIAALEDEGKYDVSIFSVNEDNNAGMLVITNDPQVLGADQHLAVALKQMVANNAEGDRVYNITFLQNGEEKTLATTADVFTNGITLVKGDLFEYSVNAEGVIDRIAFDNADGVLNIANILSSASIQKDGAIVENVNGAQYVFGAVYAKNASARLINLKQYDAAGLNAGADVAGNTYRHIIPENANIVVIDCKKGNTASDKVVVGAFGDIQASKFIGGTADEGRDYAVLIKYFKDDVVDVIVYKNFTRR